LGTNKICKPFSRQETSQDTVLMAIMVVTAPKTHANAAVEKCGWDIKTDLTMELGFKLLRN